MRSAYTCRGVNNESFSGYFTVYFIKNLPEIVMFDLQVTAEILGTIENTKFILRSRFSVQRFLKDPPVGSDNSRNENLVCSF